MERWSFLPKSTTSEIIVHKNLDTNVAIIKMFPGISEAVRGDFEYSKSKGIVLETYGAGNAPTEDWFLNLLKSNFNRFTYRKCDTMLWRKCQYGTIWDQYRHERNWVISGKTSPPRLELQNWCIYWAKYSCKGFQNRVWDFFTRWNDIILDFTFLNQFFCVICKPK
jgi:hypothetical protein